MQPPSSLPLRRAVVYRNGVGYFERQGPRRRGEVRFRVAQREVGDFLATLAVMERGGSSVTPRPSRCPRSAPDGEAPRPEGGGPCALARRREPRPARGLHRGDADLAPSYRLVFSNDNAQVQAWGIVQNLSGEDWSDVRLSLVAGSLVSFRSELATPVVPPRPVVTDQGAVIDAVPTTDLPRAGGAERPPAPPPPRARARGADVRGRDRDGRRGRRDGRRRTSEPARPLPRACPAARCPCMAPAQPMGGAYAPTPAARPPPMSSAPRNVAALAALAVQAAPRATTSRRRSPSPTGAPPW